MRIRTVKPAFFKDEHMAEMPALTRILFQGLWCLADSEGRLEYRPKFIKVEVLPYDECDVPSMLLSLQSGGFIQIYEVDGREYIEVVNFSKHQRLSGRESEEKSLFPEPPTENSIRKNRETSRKIPEKSGKTEFSGREGKGRERNTECKGDSSANIASAPPSEVLMPTDPPKTPPHVQFVEGFQAVYEQATGSPFKIDKQHWAIAARLVKDYGFEECVKKTRFLGVLCQQRSAWFTKEGPGCFTLETLSTHWNRIIPGASQPTKEQELIAEMKKQEELRARADEIIANRSRKVAHS